MQENEILEKALRILNDALDGKFVNPQALDAAIRMTQFLWINVHKNRSLKTSHAEGEKEIWDETINPKIDTE